MKGYRSRDRFLCSRKDILLFICGTWSHARTDICLTNDNEIILLIQEDKRHLELGDPKPLLIAEAVAADQMNNAIRENILNLPPRVQIDGWDHHNGDFSYFLQGSHLFRIDASCEA